MGCRRPPPPVLPLPRVLTEFILLLFKSWKGGVAVQLPGVLVALPRGLVLPCTHPPSPPPSCKLRLSPLWHMSHAITSSQRGASKAPASLCGAAWVPGVRLSGRGAWRPAAAPVPRHALVRFLWVQAAAGAGAGAGAGVAAGAGRGAGAGAGARGGGCWPWCVCGWGRGDRAGPSPTPIPCTAVAGALLSTITHALQQPMEDHQQLRRLWVLRGAGT